MIDIVVRKIGRNRKTRTQKKIRHHGFCSVARSLFFRFWGVLHVFGWLHRTLRMATLLLSTAYLVVQRDVSVKQVDVLCLPHLLLNIAAYKLP